MEPKIYTSSEHHIRNQDIDPHALTVLKRLHDAGFIAYLVGGGVRDLLLKRTPKDFDISTSAEPEQIKRLFRNCILIGRRFRLAHIRFGKQIIEVSTFRAGDTEEENLIVRDNLWGDPEEDVMRRDFTINGLFYDPVDHRIIDYVGGMEDIQKHLLRTIGNPLLRFKQDPVRMIRMQKFRARFDFQIEKPELDALQECREEIIKSSPARILEEIFRMLESGASHPFFLLLYESELLKILFPALNRTFQTETKESILAFLKMADAMNQRGHQYRPLDRSVLMAAILFPVLDKQLQDRCRALSQAPHIGTIIEDAHALIHQFFLDAFLHFPRKIRFETHFILEMQYRLTPFDKKKRPNTRLLRHKGFMEALIFLKLRALVDPSLFKSYEYWKQLWRGQDD